MEGEGPGFAGSCRCPPHRLRSQSKLLAVALAAVAVATVASLPSVFLVFIMLQTSARPGGWHLRSYGVV